MKEFARSLVLLAIASHASLGVMDAYARGVGGGGGRGFRSSGFSPSAFRSYAANPAGPSNPSVPPYGGGGTRGAGGVEGGGFRPPPPRHWGHGFGAPVFYQPPLAAPDFDPPSPAMSGECEGGLRLAKVYEYADPVEGLAKISQETDVYLDRCVCAAQLCVAEALERYAEAMEKIAPRLPRALRSLPQVVAAAAHRARAAPTKRAAAHVLRAAVAVIHATIAKTISLMRASDPDQGSAATRGVGLVAHTLNVAASALERAETL